MGSILDAEMPEQVIWLIRRTAVDSRGPGHSPENRTAPVGVIVASLSDKLNDNRSGLGRTLAEALRVSLCPRDERTLLASVTYHTPSGLRGPSALARVVARRRG